MDGPIDYHTKWRKSGKANVKWYAVESKKKNDTNELINKTKIETENKIMITKGGRRDTLGAWD